MRKGPEVASQINVFVPLSGLVSVNLMSTPYEKTGSVDLVFVPLSGLVSVNVKPEFVHLSGRGFRPLIGVSFCKPYPLQALINQGLQGALACLKFNKRFQPKLS